MIDTTHHTPDDLMAAYVAGNLPYPFALVIAAQISLCRKSRAAYEAHNVVGGIVLDDHATTDVSYQLKSNVLGLLDTEAPEEPVTQRSGVYPAPVVDALKRGTPQWKKVGGGVRQDILSADGNGSVRLLYIPPGTAVPDHTHGGLELTLVLQGSFSDETGRFGVGDLEVADEKLEHTPIANPGAPCICLAATDAPLRFRSLVPRMLQPFLQI